MLVDSHCHVHDNRFFTDFQAEEVLRRAKQNDVRQVICIGTDLEDSVAACNFSMLHNGVFWTYGVHPEGAKAYFANIHDDFPKNIDKLVAIGEVGLDYHYESYDKSAQIRLLEEMLQLAVEHDLPVSFHVREAFDDFFGVISNFPSVRGVIHSFTDSKKTLKKILENTDFYVGVNGLATYSTLPTPPISRILLETDAPFLTPVPNRGKINESAYIRDIACWLSNKLGLSVEEIADYTTSNVKKLFNLPDSFIR